MQKGRDRRRGRKQLQVVQLGKKKTQRNTQEKCQDAFLFAHKVSGTASIEYVAIVIYN